jgi:hypothetical protein
MIYNVRYVKTKIDDKNCILHQINCNFCPFMIFDKINVAAKCQKFKDLDKYNDFISKINGYSVNEKGNAQPFTKIDIPNWCQLAGTIESVQNDRWVYTKSKLIQYKTEYNDKSILPVISSNVVIYNVDGTELKIVKKFKNNYESKLTDNIYKSKTKPNSEYIKLETCSCCGKKKEKVDRDKNIGMCSECWDKNKDDVKMKNFSYINNFRLKRSKDWVDEKFKKVEKDSVI